MSMYKLSQMNPMEANPLNIRIALRTLDQLELKKGDVTLDLSYLSEDGKIDMQEKLTVEVGGNDIATKELFDGMENDESITIMHLSEEDAMKMRRFQNHVRNSKSNGEEGKGSLGVSITGNCLKTPISGDELLVDIFIQLDPTESYFAILNNLDLLEQEEAVALKDWPICEQ